MLCFEPKKNGCHQGLTSRPRAQRTDVHCSQVWRPLGYPGAPISAMEDRIDYFFHLFKHTLQFLQQINVKKCTSSIGCRDSNSQPLGHETSPITSRPGLPPKIFKPSSWVISLLHYSNLLPWPWWGRIRGCRSRRRWPGRHRRTSLASCQCQRHWPTGLWKIRLILLQTWNTFLSLKRGRLLWWP